MNIKAVFFDIDGTFYDHTSNRVLPSTKEAVRKLKEQGILLRCGSPKTGYWVISDK